MKNHIDIAWDCSCKDRNDSWTLRLYFGSSSSSISMTFWPLFSVWFFLKKNSKPQDVKSRWVDLIVLPAHPLLLLDNKRKYSPSDCTNNILCWAVNRNMRFMVSYSWTNGLNKSSVSLGCIVWSQSYPQTPYERFCSNFHKICALVQNISGITYLKIKYNQHPCWPKI